LMKVYDNHNEKLRMKIKYEELIEKTPIILKKIYDFLNIGISKNDIEEIIDKYKFEKIPESKKGPGKFYRSASPGKWKENFNENEKIILDKIMGESLKKLGYS